MARVKIEIEGAIAVLLISNPPNGYMTDSLVGDLYRAFREVDGDPKTRSIIITGEAPGVFIQHYDLAELAEMSRRLHERGSRYSEQDHIPERKMDLLFRLIEASAKPVIAAINGNAMGFGCELAMACDLRVLHNGDYLLGQPEIRVGLIPGAGGTQRLARLVGVGRAMDLVLHGRRLSPREALNIGLVNEVCDQPVLVRAKERAEELVKLSPIAVAHAKRLVRGAFDDDLYSRLDRERAMFVDTLSTSQAHESLDTAVGQGIDFRHA